ncbi:hypothetical protein DEA8626_03194 [Defluviimonas aquaemixtae]|uniref:DUF1643 domain-containing protein n=1 Tax=Albidovulum aquaemixtae TaxID=1542388 RepID=A0A2R8BL66_9RHOB|nr:DUF1643 domain-containing protein [Defluviimonas aquaemixtae]SPH24145.1 hypothetical protein DEA8626_03194 [Defluviimonas aquaemixtae]
MIIRRNEARGTRSEAIYSECGHYRYLLERRWGGGGVCCYILLNPSTATEERNDPTIERCERRARAMGFGGFAVANLFAYRATVPADLKRTAEPIGSENDATLLEAARGARMVLCGWGVHGAHLNRGPQVEARLRETGVALWQLGLTRDGHPRHPLYVGYARGPEIWPGG